MYLGIDIGATKTLVAVLSNSGVIEEKVQFLTPKKYNLFIKGLEEVVAKLSTKEFRAAGVAVPGKIDRKKGIGFAFANLDWHNVAIKKDVENIAHCPVVIENDANLAGLSEAMLVKDKYKKVLYITISTGINSSLIINKVLDLGVVNSESGELMLEHDGKVQRWESFASGKAIVKKFGKQAHEIYDPKTWHIIASNIAEGLIDLIAITQPEVIILGGSVSAYFDRFSKFLEADLQHYENALMPIPPIREAGRPNEAVVYGCYDIAKALYG